jgi:hypothetical protein
MDSLWVLILVGILILIWCWYVRSAPAKILNIYLVLDEEENQSFYAHIYPAIKRYAHENFIFYLCGKHGVILSNDPDTRPIGNISDIIIKHADADIIVYSGHSTGEELGPENNKLIKISEFGKLLRKHLQQKLGFIYFDSCNMGTITALCNLRHTADYIIATPNYYDWSSILEYPTIYSLTKSSCRDFLQLQEMVQEYTSHVHPARPEELREICIYDPNFAVPLLTTIHYYYDALVFHEDGLIEEDLYDLCRTIKVSRQNLTSLQCYLLRLLTAHVVRLRSRGPSNTKVPHSWLAIYNERKKNVYD